MRLIYSVLAIALLAVGCSSQHTVGAGNPSLGVVSITAPSSGGGMAPVSGGLTVAEAAQLMGAPFVGPTIPDLVPPGTPGVLTVSFTANSSSSVQANLKFRAGVYDFDFTTSNITGSLANATITYDGGHAGDHGSCTVWTSSNVVFTQGADVDKLDGNWMGDCHHAADARAGDRGVFHLTRPGTLAPPPPPPPANMAWCHVADPHSRQENNLSIPAEAIANGHVGHNGTAADSGYPHANWQHTLDYPGVCDGRSLTQP